MRDAKRIYSINPRGIVTRGADGKLKPAKGDREIADIWAEQKRIRLREAIEEDKRKAEKAAKRRAWRQNLLKRHKPTAASGPAHAQQPANRSDAKAVEIKINLPALPKLPWKVVARKLQAIPRKVWIGVVIALLLLLGVPLVIHAVSGVLSDKRGRSVASSHKTKAAVTGPVKGTPNYATLLPEGKTIASLGGWSRISPPDRDPVYAYVDQIAGIRIDVSEQPLPNNFKNDTADQVASLAQSFNATQRLTVNGTIAYLGTSAQGPQSVILSKTGLLILMKSVAVLSTDQWAGYINTLQ